MENSCDDQSLELEATIGFCGAVRDGLKIHPDNRHLIYPVGCTVVIEDMNDHTQDFLSGHTNDVSCLAVSRSGEYLASGQVTHMGFKADIIIWSFSERRMLSKLTLHMVKVEALAFSPNDKYLVSLGGMDDGSVVVWDVDKMQAICGSPAQVQSAGMTKTVTFTNQSDERFVTGGDGTLRVWELDLCNRKIRPTDCDMGQVKRIITCIQVGEADDFFYCGTTTGDILAVNMKSNNFQEHGPEKDKFSKGVTALALLGSGQLLVGAGDGTVCVLNEKSKKFKRTNHVQKLKGGVSSITLRGKGHQFYVGTDESSIYRFAYPQFTHELVATCHYAQVNDACFPYGSSEIFVTCSFQDIRIWSMKSSKELRRITENNMTCNAVEIMRDGRSIVSGWNDGKIRAYYPESGRMMYVMEECHNLGVTALATLSDCQRIISGGQDGNVKVWQVAVKYTQKGGQPVTKLLGSMKEHQASVTSIKTTRNDKHCVTSSTDGTCIIWDLEKFRRMQMIRVNTLFKYVCYHPDQHQIITTGTDRKIGYWETSDGSMIRELEGSKSGSINGMDISSDGVYFVSGGDNKLVKVWRYDEGVVTHIGTGHSAPITRVKISPDNRHIISVSTDGAILRWKFPF